ncbi:DUF3768 domain-containing protein [Terrihabitans rhizophilus]|uniref:DUF3768 domain-containing protein n=1 Tax=Terrihabitans rhizophilus TaxID=3092662 RepID=A0ABU4RTL4_9HYPH|nr:DUF3768 domain-containing protein [Terrihabitans sp. PJ23]MDX6806146.1 DUF3768 domain-containing protein [Terrihabitans sp. PJ23]
METRTSDRIRALNDDLRQHHRGGRIVLTAGVRSLSSATIQRIDEALASFSGFNADNDPHGEHDFGSFEIGSDVIFFKIDYFDLDIRFQSPDPADPHVTCRVLTVMLANEY